MPDLVKVVFDIPVDDSFDYISDNKKAKIAMQKLIDNSILKKYV